MASIRQHGNRWQARVRRNGFPTESRSFTTKQEAEQWARSLEVEMDRGIFRPISVEHKLSFGELIQRYMREVLPTMKGQREDAIRLRAICRRPIAQFALTNLTPERVARYRDERLSQVAPATVVRELAYLSSIINHARREWGFPISNPVSLVRKPSSGKGRERVLSSSEQDRLLEALTPTGRKNPLMMPIVQLAIETAMRRSELLAMRWRDVDLVGQTVTLHTSKNGDGRVVPLSSRAVAVLKTLPVTSDVVFPITHYALAANFNRAVRKAGLPNLRFHDLRHTAITRISDKLPNVIELASVSGHRSLKMLQRYYHPRPEDLARKLG